MRTKKELFWVRPAIADDESLSTHQEERAKEDRELHNSLDNEEGEEATPPNVALMVRSGRGIDSELFMSTKDVWDHMCSKIQIFSVA